jgi:hypothetical protein
MPPTETTALGHKIKKTRKVKMKVWKTAMSLKPNTQLMDLLTLPRVTDRVRAIQESWRFHEPVTIATTPPEGIPWNTLVEGTIKSAPTYLADCRLTIKQINFLIGQLKEACIRCGETFKPALEFHHRDPIDKLFEIGKFTTEIRKQSRNLQDLYDEVAKCDVLCANCHRKEHYGCQAQAE